MDARKQKRLGAAPIASFEKSFEDSVSAATTTNSSTTSSITSNSSATITTIMPAAAKFSATHEQETMLSLEAQSNGEKGEYLMEEPHEPHSIRKTTVTTDTTTAKTKYAQQYQQQQQQPSIAISVSGSGVIVTDADATTSSSNTSTVVPSNRTKYDGNNTKRPPSLNATHTTTTTVTSSTTALVGSDAVGQPQMQQQQQQQLLSGVCGSSTFKGATTLTTPSTPRIELSRASSSSHHEEDSRESSPENVFDQVGTGTLQETIGVGFREEGALELRSSTEELYFMDPEQKKEEQEKLQQQVKRSSPHIFKFDDHQSYLQQHQRKDSASSEVAALLCISGRTSRISSVGSQGSAVSRLSAVSGVSRSPSPHRMLLETSFCGPKPLENVVDGRVSTTIEPPTAELLEQVLLARKHDPTQAVLAEGITVESSPKKKLPALSNGEAKLPQSSQPSVKSAKKTERPNAVAIAAAAGGVGKPTMGAQRRSSKSPGQMVIGKTPSGTEYIRINLKPDYMYDDKGIAANEKVVEAPNSIAPLYARNQKKPASLSLGRTAVDEHRLTPTASPKPTRHGVLAAKDAHGSRSPSPATVSVSRKSSFSSLFRLGGKDSPDSPRERSRSRSKSKERQTPQSQNATPSKQKSVLAIFKPGKRGSNAGADAKSSKSSSPIDGHELQQQLQQQQMRSKTHTPSSTTTGGGSRPASRLRYYDEPVEGVIHIPLHTPPEEKEARKLLHGIQQLNAEPMRPVPTAITASQLAAAAAALKPVGARKGSGSGSSGSGQSQPRAQPADKLQQIENLDAIHTLSQDDDNKERTWSLEVNKHSSQDSQETAGSEASYASAIKVNLRSNLANVMEHVVQENGVAAEAEIHRLPSVDSSGGGGGGGGGGMKLVETVATVNVNIRQVQPENEYTKEKRRLLFTTRLGSGSQDQIFSTQFSISKTESQSSQLSEQMQETIAESPAGTETLHRQGTVIRRAEEEVDVAAHTKLAEAKENAKVPPKRRTSTEAATAARRQKSISTSEDEKHIVQTTVTAVVMRRKESYEETRRKSRSTSEEDAEVAAGGIANQRHSRYLENFDVRKKYHENVPRKPKRQSVSETKQSDSAEDAHTTAAEPSRDEQKSQKQHQQRKPTLPQPPPPSTAPSPSPPPTAPSAGGSRSPTPVQRAPRSQSQSPVDRSGKQTPVKPPRTTTPTRRTHTPAERQSMPSTDEPVESSESERDSDLAGGSSAAADPKRRHLPRHVGTIEDHESTGLVSQESFDELPYVPTTLPEERAQGVSLIPMKDRANMELKTCPVERPRSTTPLNPSHLEEYCGIVTPQDQTYEISGSAPVRGEKLRISLPRKDSTKERVQSAKSPRRPSNTSGKSWFEFAEEGLRATAANLERKDSKQQLLQQQHQQQTEVELKTKAATSKAITTTVQTTQTQVTPTSSTTTTQRKLSGHWIDFENIPEKRKPPKRITALPKDGGITSTTSSSRAHATTTSMQHATHAHATAHSHQPAQPDVTMDGKIHYNYVKPEDCQCECHESKREGGAGDEAAAAAGEDEVEGVTSSKSITSVDLLQQGEDMLPLLDPDTQDGIEPSDSSREYSCYTDDEMDVPMRRPTSSRSKSSSSKLDEFPRRDVLHSPRNRKFPDNRK